MVDSEAQEYDYEFGELECDCDAIICPRCGSYMQEQSEAHDLGVVYWETSYTCPNCGLGLRK